MCGIVGLHLKTADLYPRLGELLTPMLECMTSRGPDSAGIALYQDARYGPNNPDGLYGLYGGDEPRQPLFRYSVRPDTPVDWDALTRRLAAELGTPVHVERHAEAATLVSAADHRDLLDALRGTAPEVVLVAYGRAMEVYKDVGAPADICERYGVRKRAGYQGAGHTRMATESAVTTDHSHPFAPAADLALVHNGSFSNYASVRRRLAREGVHCRTDNDSEVAARYIARRMERGADLGDALRMVLKDFDGFFTLLVTTRTQFAVVRDSFACKPAVIAETPDYVAVASEYHALAGLPAIADAEVFEPVPEEVYTWTR
ncbi:MAG: glutamine amidotransferase [Streptomycetales bacterium]